MLTEPRSRYPGAQPFPDDALWRRLFYGRERESIKLTNQILANRLVVVFARSGTGKSSLLNAGVAENLRANGYIPLNIRLNVPKLASLDPIYDTIAAESQRQSVEYVAGAKDSLWDFLRTAEFWRDDVLLAPVLILDQFEELFTLHSEFERSTFVDQLSYLVRGVSPRMQNVQTEDASQVRADGAAPNVKIVLSLREDFLGELDELSDRIPGILDERFRLLPLTRSAASRALSEPARVNDQSLGVHPFELDATAQDTILNFLEAAAASPKIISRNVEPFQLQLICQYLEKVAKEKQREKYHIETRLTSRDIGGEYRLRRILKDFFREQVAAVPRGQRHRVRVLCSEYLINPQGRRLRLEESEIKRILKIDINTLHTLARGRLIRVDIVADQAYYELSHDSLIKPILELRRPYLIFQSAFLIVVVVLGLLYAFDLIAAPILLGWDSLVALPKFPSSTTNITPNDVEFKRRFDLFMLVSISIIGGIVLSLWTFGKFRELAGKWRRWRL
ncbi:hypothetical protein GCM10007874_00250 [Labrys miyagiensis]|uniref:Novel STAND NTPase 1 domain-containing protein n=1 Tax=Labrys miyagiensis TaxID=346912 RepID=A0ABQ6CAP2_9HYPH|nr:hypothetical protein [Labrys miyagiensis]GLS17010.1 hypothetical protein GCM10007874_00250 [Labrys miyagiensis]